MVTLKINSKEIFVCKDLTILQAAADLGLQIPRFCFNDKLSIAGNCRMCLVEVLKVAKPIASCAMPVADNMQVFTNSILVKKAREGVLELLLANHPLDCPICDQAGECDLQDQVMIFGNDRGRFYGNKRAVSDKVISPFIKTIMTRCIHCTRCTRFLTEIAGANQFGVLGRGSSSEIGTYVNNSITSELSGNIIDLCPVGALTSKPHSFGFRPWELRSTETVDVSDALGSSIRFDTRDTATIRVLPKINEHLNEEWITDKTRFSFDGLGVQRLSAPTAVIKVLYNYKVLSIKFVAHSTIYLQCSWQIAFNIFRENFIIAKRSSIIFGNGLNLETVLMARKLAFDTGFSNLLNQYSNSGNFVNDFDYSYLFSIPPSVINNVHVCLLVGTNLRLENPLLNSRLRKAFLNNNSKIFLIGPTMEPIYNLKKIGNSLKSLVSILEGRSSFNISLKNSLNSLILLGSDLKLNDLLPAMLFLKTFNLSLSTTFISSYISNLGFNTFIGSQLTGALYPTSSDQMNDFYFLVDSDEVAFIRNPDKSNFIVYQGSLGDRTANFANLILPSLNYTEEGCTFFSINGGVQHSNVVNCVPPKMARTSWKILKGLKDYFNLFSKKPLSNDFFRFCIKGVIPVTNVYGDWYPNRTRFTIRRSPLNNQVSNFYMTSSTSRASKMMGIASKSRLEKISINLMHS